MRHLTPDLRVAVLALLVVTASCGGSASDPGSSPGTPDAPATAPATRSELDGVAFDVRRDPG
jgi:hypothetical protein